MACPNVRAGAKILGSATISVADAQARLSASRASLVKNLNGCLNYWSASGRYWIQVWGVGNNRVVYRIVNSGTCPC